MKLSEMCRLNGIKGQWTQLPPDKLRRLAQNSAATLGMENPYQELEMDSPFVDTHEDVSYSANDDSIQLHSHTFYEVLCCRSGSIEYLIGTDHYHVTAGDIIYVPPGVSHRPIFPEPMTIPYRRYVLWISSAFQEQLAAGWPELRERANHSGILRTAGTEWAFLQDAFRRGCEEAEKGAPGWQMWVYGNTVQLTVDMMRALSYRAGASPAREARTDGPRHSLCGNPSDGKNHLGGSGTKSAGQSERPPADIPGQTGGQLLPFRHPKAADCGKKPDFGGTASDLRWGTGRVF